MSNHEPFYDSDDNEGIYKDDCSIDSIKLLYCSNDHKESLTEILISSEVSCLNRLLYRCPTCTKRYWVRKNEVNKRKMSTTMNTQEVV